jgi:hypothetical protein
VHRLLAVAASLSGLAFLLNFVWEAYHAEYLYRHHDVTASHYVPMMTYVAALDALLVLALYTGAAVVFREALWLRRLTTGRVLTFAALAVALAAGIDVKGVYLLDQWSYRPAMPTVFGLGLSPLVQLATTGLGAVTVTRRLVFPRCGEVPGDASRSPGGTR